MRDAFKCRVLASLLDSGSVLANAANTLLVVTALGFGVATSPGGRLAFALSGFAWVASCWAATRVAIDASLFSELTADPNTGGQDLDESLNDLGFQQHRNHRTAQDRCRGALRLWRYQILAVAVQISALLVGAILMRR